MSNTLTNPENVTESAGHSDIITATASPRPWRVVYARVLDAEGKTVCVCEKDSMHGRADDETAKADAAIIVDAVNERDRLRDIVRRLLAAIEATRTLIIRLRPDMLPSPAITPGESCLGVDVGDVVREARTAIGEDRP